MVLNRENCELERPANDQASVEARQVIATAMSKPPRFWRAGIAIRQPRPGPEVLVLPGKTRGALSPLHTCRPGPGKKAPNTASYPLPPRRYTQTSREDAEAYMGARILVALTVMQACLARGAVMAFMPVKSISRAPFSSHGRRILSMSATEHGDMLWPNLVGERTHEHFRMVMRIVIIQ